MTAAAGSHHRRVLRLPILIVIGAVLVGAGLTDRQTTRAPVVSAIDTMPIAAPRGALSSSWFCAGPVAAPAHSSDGQLVIVNAAATPVHGTVTLVPSQGTAVAHPVDVGPKDHRVVPETIAGSPPYLGAIVDLDGGGAVVEQVVSGTQGTASTPCATSGSGNWYFPAGTSQEASTLSLTLINPFPADAIADLSFTTEQGSEMPADFQGIVIPARGVVGMDLGSHLRRRASIATTVTVRVGKVAAFETQVVAGQPAGTTAPNAAAPWPPGVSLTRGTPSAGTSWSWPNGYATDGMTEKYVLYNPGPTEARVALTVDLDEGSSDPFQVNVDPHSVTEVVSNTESRVPKAIGHAARLTSTNGVGVVAERLVLAAAPSPQTGNLQMLGSRLPAQDWLVVPGTTGTSSLIVYNPGAAAITVSVAAVSGGNETPLENQTAVVIPGHHRAVAALAGPGRAVVVHASGGVVVERQIDPAKAIGMDASLGIALGP